MIFGGLKMEESTAIVFIRNFLSFVTDRLGDNCILVKRATNVFTEG